MLKEYSLSELIGLLNTVTGLEDEVLSEKLGISRQTISNWRNNRVDKIKPNTIHKLGTALKKNNWGIKLGNIKGKKIEIIHKIESETPSEKDELIYKLIKENFELKDEIAKYKSKKK